MKAGYNMDTIFILIILAILFFIIFKVVFSSIANGYIEENKDNLFEKNKASAQSNKVLGNKLLKNLDTYEKLIGDLGLNQEYECSSAIVANASNDIIKYLIKYSNIDYSMDYLEDIDSCINYLQALSQFHKNMLKLQENIVNELPIFIKLFSSHFEIPYIICDIDYILATVENPVFCFSYTSPAGRTGRTCEIKITPSVLKDIEQEISLKISKSNHSKNQRSAMTNSLREAIKQRDNYTCCICGNSVYKEPNLLLEVDHIIPISKGGKTEASNLQTLCWRCNRKKSNK